jgi:hypothetical protein
MPRWWRAIPALAAARQEEHDAPVLTGGWRKGADDGAHEPGPDPRRFAWMA